jgi:hypothetical protein
MTAINTVKSSRLLCLYSISTFGLDVLRNISAFRLDVLRNISAFGLDVLRNISAFGLDVLRNNIDINLKPYYDERTKKDFGFDTSRYQVRT